MRRVVLVRDAGAVRVQPRLVADTMQTRELPRNVLAPRMVLPRRPTVSHRVVSDRLMRCFVFELPGLSSPLGPFPRIASPDWSRRDGRGVATERVQLRRLDCSRLRCKTRCRWLLAPNAPGTQILPEDYAIGTFSVHLARRIRKWAGSCSVLSLASGSGRIGGYAPAHRDGRTRWAGDEASAFAKEDIFLNPTTECVDSSKGVHPFQNMVANNRPKIEFFSEAQKNAQRDL